MGIRTSVVIASRNSGDGLRRTIASCAAAGLGGDDEFIVIDDASTDGSADHLDVVGAWIRVERVDDRLGVAGARDLGARLASGRILLFLDAHCKPEPGSPRQLIEGVLAWGGAAIITPALLSLDGPTWQNDRLAKYHASSIDLDTITRRWIDPPALRVREHPLAGTYYESPALTGCALAVSRSTYFEVGGFDDKMRHWGVEDLDFALRAWLLDRPILHDPAALIGHQFAATTAATVEGDTLVANTLRAARKVFAPPSWDAWVERYRTRVQPCDFDAGWALIEPELAAIDRASGVMRQEVGRDINWYLDRFGTPAAPNSR